MHTDISEKGLESLIVKAMNGLPTTPAAQTSGVQQPAAPSESGTGNESFRCFRADRVSR